MQDNLTTSGQRKTKELSERRAAFYAALEVIKAKRNFLILTAALAVFGTFLGHYLHVPVYQTGSSLFVQALADPTAAEYLLHQQMGMRSNKVERIETYMRYLSSDQFYLSAAQRLKYHPEVKALNLTNPNSKSIFKPAFWKAKIRDLFRTKKKKNKNLHSIDHLAGFIKHITSYDSDYSHFIQITTKALDARTSQLIANIVAEEFVAITNQRGLSEINQIKEFVESKIAKTEEKLKDIELALIEFKKKNNLISTQASSDQLSERYTSIARKLEDAQIKYEENLKLLSFFEKGQKVNLESLSKDPKDQNFGVKETTYLLQRKIEQLKKKKSIIIAQQEDNQDYRIRQLNHEIARTTNVLKKYTDELQDDNIFVYMSPNRILAKIQELKEENEVLKRSIASYQKAFSTVEKKIDHIPYLAQKQFVLENNLKLENENYAALKNKLSELEIQKISHKKEIRIDQVAGLPSPMPIGSLLMKILFSLLASVFLGVCIIICLESLDPTIKHRSDLIDCGLDFIGDIPLLPREKSMPKRKTHTFGTTEDLVCLHEPESLETMAFKYVRARIESSRYKLKKKNQIISISSSSTNEGKSFVAANLAVCLSQLKRSVLILDCDLRRPSQNVFFDTNPQYGLVDLLDMKKGLDEVIMKNIVPHLDYLPAGFCNENSTEYLCSEKFRALISFLSKEYDYIIIDSPPIFAAVDAPIVASYSDIPILVGSFRQTKKSELHDAYNQILQISYKKVYGLINKAVISTSRFHYYGYHTQPAEDKEIISPLASYHENPSEIKDFIDNLREKRSS